MFTKDDIGLSKGLKKIFDDATFPLKRREALAFLSIVRLVDELPEKIEKALKAQENKESKPAQKKKTTKRAEK